MTDQKDVRKNPPSKQRIYLEQDDNLPTAVIVDVDGTLALMDGRGHLDHTRYHEDVVNKPVAELVEFFYDSGVKVIILTGRAEKDGARDTTKNWLDLNGIPFDELFMRSKGDRRPDFVVKKEIFEKKIKGIWNVQGVFEDRDQIVKMWREDVGLQCYQVWYGNF